MQLPARPSNARVKTWRRLQQLGAITVKNAVYVLPNSAEALEDFSWLRSEIQGSKGAASIFAAASVDGLDDADVTEQFQRARARDYKLLLNAIRKLRTRQSRRRDDELRRAARQLRDRLTTVRAIDFFSAPGASEAERALIELEGSLRRASLSPGKHATGRTMEVTDYQNRTWVTRPRPGIDRFASAWLISRFIDPGATFEFARTAREHPDMIPFDMFGGGFAHERNACTFEVLTQRFAIADGAVRRIGEIVHDLDLKEERFRPPQAAGIGVLVEGLRAAFTDDGELLRQGIVLFDALYRGLEAGASKTARNPTKK
jgi:hypothetical protein